MPRKIPLTVTLGEVVVTEVSRHDEGLDEDGGCGDGEKPLISHVRGLCRHFMRNFCSLFSCTFPKDIYNHPKVFSTGKGKSPNFPWWLSGKELACNTGDTKDVGSIPGLGRSPGKGLGNPFQYSCLENSHGQRSLVGYSQGLAESDMTE